MRIADKIYFFLHSCHFSFIRFQVDINCFFICCFSDSLNFGIDGDIPMEFWQLLALYICSNTLSSLPWAVSFGEGEIRVMREQAAQVLQWYDGMKNPVPGWYQPR